MSSQEPQNEVLVSIERTSLLEILKPIGHILDNDAVYSGCNNGLRRQLLELRQICQEIHMMQDAPSDNNELKANRDELLNVLQSLVESVEDSGGDELICVEKTDLLTLSALTFVIRADALICRDNNVAEALTQVADNMDMSYIFANDPNEGAPSP